MSGEEAVVLEASGNAERVDEKTVRKLLEPPVKHLAGVTNGDDQGDEAWTP